MPRSLKPTMREGDKCRYCGGEMTLKSGSFGQFLGCSGYPRCTFTAKLAPEVNAADYQTQEWLLKNNQRIDPVL